MTTIREQLNRPCTAKTPGLTGYKNGCNCRTCSQASSNYEQRRNKLIAYGRWNPFVDAEPVRQHLQTLSDAGYGIAQVALLSGISRGTINRIRWARNKNTPPTRRVRPEHAAAILAIEPDAAPRADNALVNATGTHRRTRALAAIGWTITAQAEQLGRTFENHRQIVDLKQVTARTARDVAALYDRLSATPVIGGPSAARARNWARKNGWPPPLAWEGVDIDDPAAQPVVDAPEHVGEPDPEVARRALRGQLTWGDIPKVDRPEVLRQIEASGIANSAAAALLRMNPKSLTSARARYLGLRDETVEVAA